VIIAARAGATLSEPPSPETLDEAPKPIKDSSDIHLSECMNEILRVCCIYYCVV